MLDFCGAQRSSQIGCNVALNSPRDDGIAEYLPAKSPYSVRCLDTSGLLDIAQNHQQARWRDVGYRFAAECRENVQLEPA